MFKGTNEIVRDVAILTIALAGLVHLFIAPAHYDHAPVHGLFFALAGVMQCAWAVAFWRRPSRPLYRLGIAISGGLFVLWLFTQTLGAPFGHGSEPIDANAVICKISELVGLVSLVVLASLGQSFGSGRYSIPRLAGEALLVSLLVGAVFFGLGRAAEPWLPQWAHQAEHPGEHDSTEHSHDSEHAHDAEHDE